MAIYFLSNKFYEEVYFLSGDECKIIGEPFVMHTKQNTPGTLTETGISDKHHFFWTTPIFYPNNEDEISAVQVNIQHPGGFQTNFEIKVVVFSFVPEGCGVQEVHSVNGFVDYDPFNSGYDPTGIDWDNVPGEFVDSINSFQINAIKTNRCDAIIGIAVQYTWTGGRGSGDITIDTDVDNSNVILDQYYHNNPDCGAGKWLRNPFQHNFIRQSDKIISGFLRMKPNRVTLFEREFYTNSDTLDDLTQVITLSSIFIIDKDLPAIGSNLIDYTDLFFVFDSNLSFVKKVILSKVDGGNLEVVEYDTITNIEVVSGNPDIFEISVNHKSGFVNVDPEIGEIINIELIF